MTKEEIEALARNKFSNMNGGEDENYDGYGDDSVDFDGPKKSFGSVIGASRIFTITIVSGAVGTKTVILNAAYSNSENPAGAIVLAQGVVSLITTTGNPKSFDNFAAFVNRNPTLVKGFKIRAKNSATQLEQSISVQEVTPFKTPASRVISLAAYQDENTFQDKVVTVPEEVIWSHQTLIYTDILESETMTITLFCSAILNTALMLQKKNDKAKRNKEAKGKA